MTLLIKSGAVVLALWASPLSAWMATEKTDEMTDAVYHYLTVISNEPSPCTNDTVGLQLFCVPGIGSTGLWVLQGCEPMTNGGRLQLQYKFDDGEVQTISTALMLERIFGTFSILGNGQRRGLQMSMTKRSNGAKWASKAVGQTSLQTRTKLQTERSRGSQPC